MMHLLRIIHNVEKKSGSNLGEDERTEQKTVPTPQKLVDDWLTLDL